MMEHRKHFCENPACGLYQREYMGYDQIEACIFEEPQLVARPGFLSVSNTSEVQTVRTVQYTACECEHGRGGKRFWLCNVCANVLNLRAIAQ